MRSDLSGYRRSDGTFGIRNQVLILATINSVNPTVRRTASAVPGVLPVCPGFGTGLMGEDAEQYSRTLCNMAVNPNVFGAVIIGLGKEGIARKIADAMSAAGRCAYFVDVLEAGGPVNATQAAVRHACRLTGEASQSRREPMPWTELVLGVECGLSDGSSGLVSNPVTGLVADRVIDCGGTVIMSETVEILGAEHILAARTRDETTRKRLLSAVDRCVEYAQSCNVNLLGINPIPENIKGGLSTIEEKALGAIKKGGSRPLVEVVDYGARPSKKGLVFMDASSMAVENMTAICAGGAQAIIFSTGRGHPIGNPISPTVKVTGNPHTVKHLAGSIDVDLSAVITGEMSFHAAADTLEKELVDICTGKQTQAELLGETEVAVSRIGRTL